MLNIIFRRCILIVLLFCKQKTAYVMRISDLSSDVCSSDLEVVGVSLEDAEQTVVHAPAMHPDLVEARHAAVHRLPLTATGERRRRSLRHGMQHRVDTSSALDWDRLVVFDRRHGSIGISFGMSQVVRVDSSFAPPPPPPHRLLAQQTATPSR